MPAPDEQVQLHGGDRGVAWRAGAHGLEDDRIGGLVVVYPDTGEFEPVDPPLPGSLLVNIGDIATVGKTAQILTSLPHKSSWRAELVGRSRFSLALQAWSNGELHNVRHRVRCVAAVPRISIALFLLAPKDDVVQAPEAFVTAGRQRRFKTFRYDDYRQLLQSTGERDGQALARLAA